MGLINKYYDNYEKINIIYMTNMLQFMFLKEVRFKNVLIKVAGILIKKEVKKLNATDLPFQNSSVNVPIK